MAKPQPGSLTVTAHCEKCGPTTTKLNPKTGFECAKCGSWRIKMVASPVKR